MLISLLFILFATLSNSQEQQGYALSASLAMNRMDLFTGVRFDKRIDRAQVGTGFELGINRTFFQARIFPRLTVGADYLLLDKEKCTIGPSISYSYSFLEINQSSIAFHQWNEIYGGYTLTVGKTWRLYHALLTGWMNERYTSQITQKKEGVNTLGFYFNIGLGYAW